MRLTRTLFCRLIKHFDRPSILVLDLFPSYVLFLFSQRAISFVKAVLPKS